MEMLAIPWKAWHLELEQAGAVPAQNFSARELEVSLNSSAVVAGHVIESCSAAAGCPGFANVSVAFRAARPMFDGAVKQRGAAARRRGAGPSRAEVLAKAREDRKRRELARESAEAVAKLQRSWRGVLGRKAAADVAAADAALKQATFQSATEKLDALFKSQGKEFPGLVPPAPALTVLLRCGAACSPVVVAHGTHPVQRAAWIAGHLSSSLEKDGAPATGFAWLACRGGAETARFVALVGGFLSQALAAVRHCPVKFPAEKEIVLAAARKVLAPSTWKAAAQSSEHAGSAADASQSWQAPSALNAVGRIAQRILVHGGLFDGTQGTESLLSIALEFVEAALLSGCRLAPEVWTCIAGGVLAQPLSDGSGQFSRLAAALLTPLCLKQDAWGSLLKAVDQLMAAAEGAWGGSGTVWQGPLLRSASWTRRASVTAETLELGGFHLLQNVSGLYCSSPGSTLASAARGAAVCRCLHRLALTVPLHLAYRTKVDPSGHEVDPHATLSDDEDWELGEAELAAARGESLSHPPHLAQHNPATAIAYALLSSDSSILSPTSAQVERSAVAAPAAASLLRPAFLQRLCSDILSDSDSGGDRSESAAALDLGGFIWTLIKSLTLAAAHGSGLLMGRPSSAVTRLGAAWARLRSARTLLGQLLSTLASSLGGTCVAQLWSGMAVTWGVQGDKAGRAVSRALSGSDSSRNAAAFAALCCLARFQLTTMPDAEFLADGGRGFIPLADVSSLIATLNTALFHVGWQGEAARSTPLPSRSVSDLAFLTEGCELYEHLYERHCRHPGEIVPGAAWLWPRISESDLSSEALVKHHTGASTTTPSLEVPGHTGAVVGGLFGGPAVPPVGAQAATGAGTAASQPVFGSSRAIPAALRASRALFVITHVPMAIPFKRRAALFADLLAADRAEHQSDFGHGLRIRIRRASLLEDTKAAFSAAVASRGKFALKERMQVTFISADGHEEAGIDGGGVFKEWIDAVTTLGFGVEYGMFMASASQELYPNPASGVFDGGHLDHFVFLGRLLGKAVYEGMLVEPIFAQFFLKKVLGRANLVDDLQSLDRELYKNLMMLRGMDQGDVESLGLAFEATVPGLDGPREVELVPGGSAVTVTGKNLLQYIVSVAHLRLNTLIAPQTRAFLSGFRDVLPLDWIRMFSPPELQLLIGGTPGKMDVQDMRAHTVYAGGYHDQHPVIKDFWDVLEHDFSAEDQAALLTFLTSCSRPPLLGFKSLDPKVAIHRVPLYRAEDAAKLPSSATCMNLLKLPEYPNKALLREKLKYAIHSASGFELS